MNINAGVRNKLVLAVSFGLLFTSCSSGSLEQESLPKNTQETVTEPSDDALIPRIPLNNLTYIAVVNSEPTKVKIYEEPSLDAKVIYELDHPKKITNSEKTVELRFTILPTPGPEGWYNVNLPVRPNGSTGWIVDENIERTNTSFKIQIDSKNFNLKVLNGDKKVIDTPVAIGNGTTPTPIGKFYITELIDSVDPSYGPFAYGLSGFSETLDTFKGNEAIIGIHGTNDPTSIGKNVSHGCVRLPNELITAMAEFLPLGTPVEII